MWRNSAKRFTQRDPPGALPLRGDALAQDGRPSDRMSIDVMHHDEDHDRIAAITGQPTGGWRRIAPCAAGERIPRSTGAKAKAKVPTRYRRLPKRANRCGTLRDRVSQAMQALWLCVSHREHAPDCHGKEGVAGSSPAEGSQKPHYSAVFSFSERIR
jgi:hypothetical protein